ncbi:hypothetical protein [Alishewanella longhuensis]
MTVAGDSNNNQQLGQFAYFGIVIALGNDFGYLGQYDRYVVLT